MEMEKREDRDRVSLLSGFYKDEEHSTSSSSLSHPSDFEPQEDGTRKYWTRILFQYSQCIFWHLLSIFLSIVASIIPSFVYRPGASQEDPGSDRRLSPTAYLDGLRGIACFVVYIHHFVLNWFPNLRHAYGSPENRYFLQLPIIRVVFEGQSAVATFFVISGYAISYSALSKMHKGDLAGILNTLSSSTLRRCVRIYVPCAVNTFICMLLQYNEYFIRDPLGWNNMPPRFDTFPAQFWDWWAKQKTFMYPFLTVEGSHLYSPPYNGHLWTIPLEIRGSFVVYGTVLAVAKLTPVWRMVFLIGWDCYLYYMGKWDLFLFVGGVVLANLDIPRHAAAKKAGQDTVPEVEDESLLPTSETMDQMSVHDDLSEQKSAWAMIIKLRRENYAHVRQFVIPVFKVIRSIAPYVLFFLALWLLSFPSVPHMKWVYPYVPDSYIGLPVLFGDKEQGVRIIGSMLLAFSLSLSASTPTSLSSKRVLTALRNMNLQWLFTNAFSQYLGRISFGFYLMHGPVLFCIGTRWLGPAWGDFEKDHDNGAYVKQFIYAVFVNTTAIFWVADFFTRVVDERTVRWASWVARFMSRKAVQTAGAVSAS